MLLRVKTGIPLSRCLRKFSPERSGTVENRSGLPIQENPIISLISRLLKMPLVRIGLGLAGLILSGTGAMDAMRDALKQNVKG